MFAVREVPQASMGYSPFELLYGYHPRGILDVVREEWEEEANAIPILPDAYVSALQEKFQQVAFLAQKELGAAQLFQIRYDGHIKSQSFQIGQIGACPPMQINCWLSGRDLLRWWPKAVRWIMT